VDNLLRNAAAASPHGSVIELGFERRGGDWTLEIRNPGDLSATRAAVSARGASVEGLGLGLSISRHIAASAGGRIELGAKHGTVTCTLSWPAHQGEEA
jgi:signal transduction histidine kinase